MAQKEKSDRQASIDKLASPEQLDVLIQVTSPAGWLALATIGVLLIGVMAWGVAGEIPTRVNGQGILAAGEYFTVRAAARGSLSDLFVEVGDYVTAGQEVATIDQPTLEQDKNAARLRYQQARDQYDDLRRTHQANVADWEDAIRGYEDSIARLDEDLADEREKVGDPNYAQSRVEEKMDALRERIKDYQRRIDQTEQRIRESRNRLRSAKDQADRAEQEWTRLRERQSRFARVTTGHAGRIVETPARPGDKVQRGEVLVRGVSEYADGFKATFFVDSGVAAEIRKGMTVEVSPTNIKKEEFGYLKGEVIERSPEPLTRDSMLRVLGGVEDRVKEFLRGRGAVYLVRAKLFAAETPTGYEWSSGRGPESGSLVANQKIKVNVITKTRAPYTLVIPMLRKTVGMQ
jgi:HlyD family secretion protein